jgi:uncharacterized protein YdaU (DUF1376 family)
MSLPYFPMYAKDYEAKTSHLTLEEDGAYNRLLRLMWMTPGCSVPNDDAWIMRRMRVDQATFDGVVKPIINEFFTASQGRLFSPRLQEEWKKVDETSKKRSAAGKKGGRPKAIENKQKDEKPSLIREKAGPKHPEPEPYSTTLEDKSSNDSDAVAASDFDPVKAMFDSGVRLLGQAGIREQQARAILGKWKKAHGPEQVVVALGKAQREGAIDPVSFCEGVFRFQAKSATPRDGATRTLPSGQMQIYSSYDGWKNLYG